MAKDEMVAKKPEDSKYDKYAIECAMRTLSEADEIRSDPKMMKLVKEKSAKQHKAITSLADLDDAYNEKVAPKDEDEEEDDEGEA